MTQPLRIAVADDEPDVRDYFRRILPRLGHQVVAVARTGRELVEQCRGRPGDHRHQDARPGRDRGRRRARPGRAGLHQPARNPSMFLPKNR